MPNPPLDPVHLWHGPYQIPAWKRGDRAFCLARDADVIVTGWTDAPLPWPRCRALDMQGGGSALLCTTGGNYNLKAHLDKERPP